uniref:Ribosomal protein L32 n=1 Tax=Parascaris equorum TaxID=6256 RepID=A0A914RJ45_PAREQ
MKRTKWKNNSAKSKEQNIAFKVGETGSASDRSSIRLFPLPL